MTNNNPRSSKKTDDYYHKIELTPFYISGGMKLKYQPSWLEDLVYNIYKNIGIQSSDQLDPVQISEKLNIRLIFSGFGSMASEWLDKPEINICNNQSSAKQWEDFGHEFGHLLRTYGNQSCLSRYLIHWQEVKAENFALQFCVPTFMLQYLYIPQLKQEATLYISERFNVTCQFAEQRLNHFENQIKGTLLQEHLCKVAEYNSGFYF